MAGAHTYKLAPKKFLLSSVRPRFDDLHGSVSPDREMTIEQLLRPTITEDSDHHLGLTNGYTEANYEMERHVQPEIRAKNGDYVDLQAMGEKGLILNIIQLLFIDQGHWLQAKRNIQELNTPGNHDQPFSTAGERGRSAGFNFFPAIRSQHPDQRDEVRFHGHQPESDEMVLLPTRIASGMYDDMVSI